MSSSPLDDGDEDLGDDDDLLDLGAWNEESKLEKVSDLLGFSAVKLRHFFALLQVVWS